jgi:two-component system sensor histidine kinase/response regulator
VQTADKAMLEGEVSESILKEALEICPPLADTNPATREILLRAAPRIPDQEDRRLFISTCSGDAVRAAISEGKYSAEIRYRRFIGSELRWVSSSAEVLPDPDSGDLIAFYYTKDIDEEVTRAVLNDEIISKNYASVSYLDLHTGVFHVLAGTDRALWSLNGMQYGDALDKAAGDFVSEEDAETHRMQLSLDTITDALREKPYYVVYNTRREVEELYPGKTAAKNEKRHLLSGREPGQARFSPDRRHRHLRTGARKPREAGDGASRREAGEQRQIELPLADEPRNPHAAQRHHRHGHHRGAVHRQSGKGGGLHLQDRPFRPVSALAHQRHSGYVAHRERQNAAEKRAFLFPEFISSVNNIIYPQVRAKGVDYECTVSAEVGDSYLGDEMKLQQVLVNVLGNAVKFTAKGKISLDVSVLGRESASGKGALCCKRYRLRDRGGEPDRIFDAFEQVDTSSTTVFGGTGLGLAITKNLVGLMGGMISVRSIVGVGSEFTIDVPLTDRTKAPARKPKLQAESSEPAYADRGRRSADLRTDAKHSQGHRHDRRVGHEPAAKPWNASRQVRPEKHYDFILIDWKMPDMDGIETTQEIRRIVGPDVTIIIISAYDWQSIEAEARRRAQT